MSGEGRVERPAGQVIARRVGRTLGMLAVGLLIWLAYPALAVAQQPPDRLPGSGRVALEGELDVFYEDGETTGRLVGLLHADNRRVPLRFGDGVAPNVPSGSRVRVTGDLADGTVTTTSISAMSVSSTQTMGQQDVLVILMNFSNDTSQPFSAATVGSVNDQVRSYYLENTYGQTTMAFTVTGWYSIAASNTTCDYYTWASQAEAAATNAGFNVSAYDRLVFAFPRASACSWTGVGNVSGPRSWVNGSYVVRTVAHEQGHNFGDHHSRSLRCDASSCTTVEYGDDRDVLGASGVVAHMNAFQKERLGWLNYGASPAVQTVTGSGDYWIANYETTGTQPKALRVWNDATGEYYYVESRAKVGFDASIAAGVTLHAGSPTTGYGYQVDLAPQTTIWDSTLDVGQTFTDATLGLYVTTLSTGTDGSLVRVEFGQLSCTQAAPTVVLTPASQFGRDGTTMQMGVSVTNNDGVGCAAAPFSLTAAVPAGWAASFSSLPSLAPGATGSTTLSVAVPAGASGAYPIGVTASNTASALIGTATGSITAATALSVTAAASVSASKSNRTIAVTTAVTSASTALAGAAVQVTIQRPGGATSTLSATTGSDGRASVRLSLKRSDPSGVYQVRVDASQNGVTGSATTAVTVP